MHERDLGPTSIAIGVDVGRERDRAARLELEREPASGGRPAGGYGEEVSQSAGARLGSRAVFNFEW
jgi:hypothetical protein